MIVRSGDRERRGGGVRVKGWDERVGWWCMHLFMPELSAQMLSTY